MTEYCFVRAQFIHFKVLYTDVMFGMIVGFNEFTITAFRQKFA